MKDEELIFLCNLLNFYILTPVHWIPNIQIEGAEGIFYIYFHNLMFVLEKGGEAKLPGLNHAAILNLTTTGGGKEASASLLQC